MVKLFSQNTQSEMFDRVLNTPLRFVAIKENLTSSAETDSIVNMGKPWKARYFCFLGEIDHYKSYARKYFFLHCIMYLWNTMKTFPRVKPDTPARNFAIKL